MHFLHRTLLLLATVVVSIAAVNVEGYIAFNDICPDIKTLNPAKVVLDTGRHSAHVWKNGKFVLYDVQPGSYVLNVLARDHVFDQFRVDVVASNDEIAAATSPSAEPTGVDYKIQVRPYPLGTAFSAATSLPLLSTPLFIKPRAAKVYAEPKQDFNVINMFRGNPLMLVMLGSVAMMFMMPKMMAAMDPEERKELLERQNKMMSMHGSMANLDVGSSLSKLVGGGTQPPPSPDMQAAGSSKKGKNRKR